MRLTTWNVNGIRNPFSYPPWNAARTFPAMFDILASDIVVMQELKIQRKDLRDDMVLIDGWDCYFSLPKHKKGYSGVAIYTRNATCAPIRAEEGLLGVLPSTTGAPYCELPPDQSIGGYPNALQVAEIGVDPVLLDAEGRCVIVEFPAFVLLGVYSPANSNGLRDDFRYGFICALDCRIRNLIKLGKRVVLVGDLNVSRDEIDSAGALDDIRKAGMTHEEYISTPNRRIFNQIIIDGEVIGDRDEGREKGVLWDTSRKFHAERVGMYTHWETKVNARPGNFGSRIDYVLVSDGMISWLKYADIQEGLLGSDHCPVYADFLDEVEHNGGSTNLLDLLNPPGYFVDGQRKQDWKVSCVPAFSGKRLPEFDKRRSIKSMFAAPSLSRSQSSFTESVPDASRLEADRKQLQSPINTEAPLLSPRDVGKQATQPSVSPLKRAPSTMNKEKSTKKARPDTRVMSSKGQQSLKGFFQAASKAGEQTKNSKDTPEEMRDGNRSEESSHAFASPTKPSQNVTEEDGVGLKTPKHSQTQTTTSFDTINSDDDASTVSPSEFVTKLAAAEENQKSWGVLFSRPVAPLCEGHQEPCKTMLTKKKGSNQGRSFWMCARPLGPSGSKERGTEWRCPTFIWCSDWSNKNETTKDGG